MRAQGPKASFDAAATAAGLVIGTDLASQSIDTTTTHVQPLTMKGLKYLVWDLGLDVPTADSVALLCNIQAAATGKGTAWPQT